MKKIIYIIAIIVLAVIIGSLIQKNKVKTVDEPTTPAEEKTEATVGIQSVTPITDSAATSLLASKNVTWETSSVGTVQTVDINLLKKVSDSPISYTFVRKIATNTANDGSEVWTPRSNETSKDLYLEVTCSSTGSIDGCKVVGSPIAAN